MSAAANESSPPGAAVDACRRRHLRFGWIALVAFLSIGLVLEALHGLKVDWYLNVSSEYRRLMLTLAHAHGTLLALVNLALAASLPSLTGLSDKARVSASTLLCAATILLPLGFLLGGLFLHGSDPGLGVLLVPAGGVLLVVSVAIVAKAAWKS